MSSPGKYRKKPVMVEAMQWDGTAEGATPILDWVLDSGGTANYRCDSPDGCPGTAGTHYLAVGTLEGNMLANAGDYIVRGTQGNFYPRKPDVFAATYEVAQ